MVIWGLGIVVLIYLLVSVVLFIFFTNNFFFWRKGEYHIPFGLEEGRQERKFVENPKIAYTLCSHPKSKGWAVFFHSWGRNSARMVSIARPYWEKHYSLLFVDARGFGLSQYTRESTALLYARDTIRIMKKEGISNPIAHGLSFGAIAATILAKEYPVRALVVEALTSDLTTLYNDFFRALRIPKWLFWWIPALIYHYDFPWEEYSPKNILKELTIPVFLIHGGNDIMFPPEVHFEENKRSLQENKRARFWLVKDSLHSKMYLNPLYPQRIKEFLDEVERVEQEGEMA